MKVPDKATARRLYEGGAFGNKLRTWNSYMEWVMDRHFCVLPLDALYALRVWAPGGGGPFVADLHDYEVQPAYQRLIDQGWPHSWITLNECAPDDQLLVQGELMRTPNHLYFRYNTQPMRMREGMRIAKDMEGVRVREALKHWLTPSSYSDLEELLEEYPDSVIELSAYRTNVGNCPGRNMLVWEIREY